jgi:hypothetical protein
MAMATGADGRVIVASSGTEASMNPRPRVWAVD